MINSTSHKKMEEKQKDKKISERYLNRKGFVLHSQLSHNHHSWWCCKKNLRIYLTLQINIFKYSNHGWATSWDNARRRCERFLSLVTLPLHLSFLSEVLFSSHSRFFNKNITYSRERERISRREIKEYIQKIRRH